MHREIDEMNLTAYALGELQGAEREAIEARLAANAADRRFVEGVRAAARAITDELAREQTSGLDAIHYAAIELRLRDAAGRDSTDRHAASRARVGLAWSLAASIAIVCGGIGIVLLALARHGAVAVNVPATQPARGPVLIPLESLPPEHGPVSNGLAEAPAGADPFVGVADHPVSSFAMNADIASYDEVRQALSGGRLPARESVKIEGLINAFTYDDAPAPAPGAIFGAGIEIGRCPWSPDHRLARIQVKARPGQGTAAEDARTEVAFNPTAARSYRLIGYEGAGASTRLPRTGERVASGQSVTALYEVVPANAPSSPAGDLLTLRVRYRPSIDTPEQMIQFAGPDANNDAVHESIDFRFAAAVAEFGMVLRDSPGRGRASLNDAIALAQSTRGPDRAGERKRFIELAQRAKSLLG